MADDKENAQPNCPSELKLLKGRAIQKKAVAAGEAVALRFGPGDRVACDYGGGWSCGVVTMTHYREAKWAVGKVVPYQIRLDGTRKLIFAEEDNDTTVQAISEDGAGSMRRAGSVAAPSSMQYDRKAREAEQMLLADENRANTEAEQAMQQLLLSLEEEDVTEADGVAGGGKQPKKARKKKRGRKMRAPAPAAGDAEAEELGKVQEEARVQRVREQLLHERAEAADRERAFKEAHKLQREPAQQSQTVPVPSASPALPECPVCMECYERPPSKYAPVNLPCGHSVCRHCALQLQAAAAPSQFACPSCRQQLELPSGGAQALPCNYGLVEMLGLLGL